MIAKTRTRQTVTLAEIQAAICADNIAVVAYPFDPSRVPAILKQYVGGDSSPLAPWQAMACSWAKANRDKWLAVDAPAGYWRFYANGAYVVIECWYIGQGGPRAWISANDRKLINPNPPIFHLPGV